MWKIIIYILAVLLATYVGYKGGYRQGKEDFEKEYIPKFKEHSIMIDSLNKKADRLMERYKKIKMFGVNLQGKSTKERDN